MRKAQTAAGTETQLGHYELGATTYFASQADQRFGYYLYVPPKFAFEDAHKYVLTVVVHGTGRTPCVYRDLFAEFAEQHDAIIVAPMFPAGIEGVRDLAGYKLLQPANIRYDRLLLDMVEEIADRYRLTERRFLAFGFSGGGHFVHRFAYLQPRRLLGLSVGAPGMVTLLDPALPWWRGTKDLEAHFGEPLDLAALQQVPVQMIVGAEDIETWEITIQPSSRFWMQGANDAGRTRIERLRALARSFEQNGIRVRLDEIAGIGHEGAKIIGPVANFFASVLHGRRSRANPKQATR